MRRPSVWVWPAAYHPGGSVAHPGQGSPTADGLDPRSAAARSGGVGPTPHGGCAMTSATATPAAERELIVAPLDDITIPVDNHRKDLGDLAALAESIRQIGIVQPPTVRRREGG